MEKRRTTRNMGGKVSRMYGSGRVVRLLGDFVIE
jgi:hypothetical protein